MFGQQDLERFVEAQESTWAVAMSEIDRGQKTGHWMWWIYPQLRGLGRSHRATYFGLADGDEARRYLAHPLLGRRLVDSFVRLIPHSDSPVERIFGVVDSQKLNSSATLFAAVAADPRPFEAVLAAFFGGRHCAATLQRLGRG